MADNTLYNNLMRAGYAATGGTGAAFENKPDGSVIIHPASDKAWYGSQKLADTARAGATGQNNNQATQPSKSPTVPSYNRNTRKEQEDQDTFQNRGWSEKTPGYVTQGVESKGTQNWLDRAIAAIARNAELPEDNNPVATTEDMTPGDYHNQKGELLRQEMLASQGKPYYGLGNIDLNSRPMLDNPDGSYSTVDSFSVNIDNKEVLLPTVIKVNGQWQHVDQDTAIQHFFDTGEYLGMFNTPQETAAYARMLHENQDAFYSPRRGRN